MAMSISVCATVYEEVSCLLRSLLSIARCGQQPVVPPDEIPTDSLTDAEGYRVGP